MDELQAPGGLGQANATNSLSAFLQALKGVKKEIIELDETGVKGYFDKFTQATKIGKQATADYLDSIKSADSTMEGYLRSIGDSEPVFQDYKKYCENAKKATEQMSLGARAGQVALKGLATVGNMLTSMFMAWVATSVIEFLVDLAQVSDTVAQKAQEMSDAFENSEKELKDYQKQIADLHETIGSSTSSIEEVKDARIDLLSIQDEMIEKYGDEVNGINLVTQAINNQSEAFQTLTEKQWEALKIQFNEENFANSFSNWLNGYSNNVQRMLDKYEDYDISLDLEKAVKWGNFNEQEKLIKELEKMGAIVTDDGYTHFARFSGTASEIYDKLLDISVLSKEFDLNEDWGNHLTTYTNTVKEVADKYEDFYKQYVLYEEIFPDEHNKSLYEEINNMNKAYQDAIINGDEKAQEESLKHFHERFGEILASDLDSSVLNIFKDLYPALQAEAQKWDFKVNILPQFSSDKFSQVTDAEILEMLTTDEGYNFSPAEHWFNTILSQAKEYGIVNGDTQEDVELLLGLLVEWGIIQGEITEKVKETATFTDFLALENAEGDITTLGKISESIDKIQNAYKTLNDAIEEYNENGYFTIDTLQSVIELGSGYLEYLVDEEGNIRLDKEALQQLTLARLRDLQAQGLQELQGQVESIKSETDVNNFCAQSYREKAEGISQCTEEWLKWWATTQAGEQGLTEDQTSKVLEAALERMRQYNALFKAAEKGVLEDPDFGIGGGSSASSSKKFFDWIETALSRIQRTITNLGNTVSATYKKWSTRNDALAQELTAVNQEIALQQAAYDAYISEANAVGLSEDYQKLVQSGGLHIEDITDDTLADQIERYKEYYEKALAASDAVEELRSQLADLARTKFDNISTQYDQKLGLIEHNISVMEGYINQAETAGYLAGQKYYESMIQYQEKNIPTLKAKYSSLVSSLNESVSNGSIQYESEEWNNMRSEINDVELALLEANTALIEYNNSLRQLNWDVFDRIQDYISNITEESEWLIDLLDNDKLFDDFGNMTKRGLAAQGLHAVNYNTYMEQADRYAQEILDINEEIAQDPNNLELIDRRNELLELQRDAITNAESEKGAIKELAEEGYNIMLESLQKLIDKRKEAMQAEKDMHDYSNSISEQTDSIASYRKQLMAYAGDNSEEAKATIQKLQVSLDEAEKELQETQYDRWLSDQEQMLDDLYSQTEEWVNVRLDDINGLISDAIAATNENADQISSTLNDVTSSVGYTITEEMNNIWTNESIAIDGLSGVVATYGDILNGTMTSVKEVISTLNVNTVNLGEIMKAGFETSSNVSSVTPPVSAGDTGAGTTGTVPNGNPEVPKVDKAESAVVSNRYNIYDIDTGQRLASYTTVAARNNWLRINLSYSTVKTVGWDLYVRKIEVGSRPLGGGGVSYNEAYASGTTYAKPGINLVAEKGKEIIKRNDGSFVLASGAQLYPFKGGETVYNATDTQKLLTSNITPMTINDIFKDVATPDTSNIASKVNNNVNNQITMTITLPGVKNYEEFVAKLKADQQFEKYVQSVTFDQALGKNSLLKRKY